MYGSQRPQRGFFNVPVVCEVTPEAINDAFQHLSRQLDDAVAPAISQNFDSETGKLLKIKCGSMGPTTVQCGDPQDWTSEITSDLEAGRASDVLAILPDKSYLVRGRVISGTKGKLGSYALNSSTELPTSTTPTDEISATELHYDCDVIAVSPTNDHVAVWADGEFQVVGISNGNLTVKGSVTPSTTPSNGGAAIWTTDDKVVVALADTTDLFAIFDVSDPTTPVEDRQILASASGLASAKSIAINADENVLYICSDGVESWNWADHEADPTVGTAVTTGARTFNAFAYSEDDNFLIVFETTSTTNMYWQSFDIQTTDTSVFASNTVGAITDTFITGASQRAVSVSRTPEKIGVGIWWQTSNDGGLYLINADDLTALTIEEKIDAVGTVDTNYSVWTPRNAGEEDDGRIWTSPGLDTPIEIYKPNSTNFIIPCQLEVGRIKLTLTNPPCSDVRVITGIPANHGVITNLDADLLDGKHGAYYLDHGNLNGLTDDDHPQYLLRDLVNGSFKESFDALVTSDGATVTLAYEKSGGGDLTAQLSTGISTLVSGTIALTAGSDSSPTGNYIYVLGSTGAVTKSTSDWPSAEHIKIGYFLVPSATFVQNNGVYINQNWNDHLKGTDNQGHLLHMAERSRRLGAIYFSGIDGNGTDDYLTPGVGTTDLKATAGVVYQMHRHAVPAFDTSAGDVCHVVNWFGNPYFDITDLFDISDDSTGSAIGNNQYFNLVIWAVANKSGEYSPMMINLPGGTYSTQAGAENDTSGFDDFSIPAAFSRESSTGFLIARITIRMGATWTVVSTVDLRGLVPSTASGGTPSGATEFADNVFEVFDESDVTKILAFQCSGITTGNTRTLTIPDASGTIELEGHTHSASEVTTGVFADARISETSVTQHEGAIDHGSIAGLADDDHTMYIRADGTRAFSGDVDFGGNFVDNAPFIRGYIDGLITEVSGTDASHDIGINPGVGSNSLDTDDRLVVLSSLLWKKIDAAWAVGTNQGGMATGSVAAFTEYNLILIQNDLSDAVDVMFDVSATGANVPANWTATRRIGSVFTDGSSNIILYAQHGDYFRFTNSVLDLSDATGTLGTYQTATVRVPPGQLGHFFVYGDVGTSTQCIVYLREGSDVGTGLNVAVTLVADAAGSTTRLSGGMVFLPVDASSQVDYTLSGAGGTWGTYVIYTWGWMDDRGRNQ
jgi:hypothetical protein